MRKFIYIKRLSYLFFIAMFGFVSQIQGQTFKAFVKAADEAFERKDYYSALNYYQSAYEFNEQDINIAFRVAESARLFDSYSIAAAHYKIVADTDKNNNYPDALFYLASMNNYLGNLTEAKLNYEAYITEFGEESEKYRFAQKRLEQLDWVIEMLENPDDLLNPQVMGGGINTGFSEFNPILFKDNFYYSSLRFPNNNDSFVPKRPVSRILRSEGESAGLPVEEFDLEGFHTAHISINSGGTRAYFTKCEYLNGKDIRCDIYSSEIIDEKFTDFKKLPEPVNVEGKTSTQPSWAIIDGKEVLLFASDRDGGKGGLDLYRVDISGDVFSNLTAMSELNTEWNEATPYYSPVKDEIYFSSQGHNTLGGYDIFRAKRNNEGAFVRIFNIDPPMNSTFNDLYYFLNETGDTAYFASNRNSATYIDDSAEACCNDIFKTEIPNVEIKLIANTFNKLTNDSLTYTNVVLIDDSEEFEPVLINTQEGNTASFDLERRKNYTLVGYKDGFKPDTLLISTYDIREAIVLEKNLYLEPDVFMLDVYTFKREDNSPLNSAKITIIDDNDPSNALVLQMGPFTNHLIRELDKGKKYTIIGSKIGYKSDTLRFDSGTIPGPVFTANLYLGKGDLEDFIPLAVYFDNDHPSPRSMSVRTPFSYSQTYPNYVKKHDEFISKFTEPLANGTREDVKNEFDFFFQLTLPEGKELLDLFIATLEEDLIKGEKVTITIQGFASPIASDIYNMNISKRRIHSMINDISRYKSGTLRKYFNNGQLKIEEKPVGERMAPKNISDIVSDRRNSVYSLPASRERRAEIIEIQRRK